MPKAGISHEGKIRYLSDHLPYEVLMLRHAITRLNTQLTQLDWNAYFETFLIHARNLVNFLSNGDKDNVKASDFVVGGFRRRKPEELMTPFGEVGLQVFHLGKDRPSEIEMKIVLKEAITAHEWIEANFSEFIESLDSNYKSYWKGERADPITAKGNTLVIKATGYSATNHIVII